MNASDLLALRRGDTTFAEFRTRHARYMQSRAGYFARSLRDCLHAPCDADDLVQIGWVELWSAVQDYLWMCADCHRAARTRVEYEAHRERKHGSQRAPVSCIRGYTHTRVGLALEHEARRYRRRQRWLGPVPTVEGATPPRQESHVYLRELVESVESELGAFAAEVLIARATGESFNFFGDRNRSARYQMERIKRWAEKR